MDILGAFIEPEATALQMQVVSSSVEVANNDDEGLASPDCPVGCTLTGGACGTSEVGHAVENTEPSFTARFCFSNNQSGSASVMFATAVCARVPGR